MIPQSPFKPSAEEYKSLRDEMNQIQQNVRMLWASALGFYLTALGVFSVVSTNLYMRGPDPKDAAYLLHFLSWGGGNVMTSILLVIVLVALFLGYTWQRQSYYIGSYILIFHEGFNSNFKWITLNRSKKEAVLDSARTNIPNVLSTMGMLVLLGLLPSIVGMWTVFKQKSNYSPCFVATQVFVIILIGFCLWRYRCFQAIYIEQPQMTKAWELIALEQIKFKDNQEDAPDQVAVR